jgi:hypothetical protein
MNNFNFNREWEFIVNEIHKRRSRKNGSKNEILFYLQVLLSKLEIGNYISLKNIYKKI